MTRDEALRLLQAGDLLELGMEADRVRKRLHPENAVTYSLTAPAGLRLEDALRSAALHDGTHVCLAAVAEAAALTPALLEHAAQSSQAGVPFSDLPLEAPIRDLVPFHDAGVRSVLLRLRVGSEKDSAVLREAVRAARALHLTTRVSLTIDTTDSPEERVDTLLAIRALADLPIDAFELLVHHANGPDARREDEATAAEYLKTLAVARILLDEVPHVQAAWSVQGPKVLELALRFGADDAGSVPWTQTGSAEPSHHGGESELRRIIRDAGFRPVERDALFRASLLH